MIDPDHLPDELLFDDVDLDQEESWTSPPPRWRKPFLIVVAALTALAIAMVPLYNVIFSSQIADNGLEICGFDYCVVQEAVRQAGLDEAMGRLSTQFLDDAGASDLAATLVDHLDIDPVTVTVVQDLDGRLGGTYDPETRLITIESPARAWTVLHEVAHAVANGHGEEFQETVVQMAAWLETTQS